MSQLLTFTIPGSPVPCARPRLGKHGNVYTPKETLAYEQHVAIIANAAAHNARWAKAPSGTHVSVRLIITRGPGKRGDLDNIAKSVLDGITKAANVWADDRDVHRLHADLNDSADGLPRVWVEIEAA